jgi:spermidine synthase
VEPLKHGLPAAYFGPASGIGLLMTHHPRRSSADPRARGLRVGIIGLGAGTIAAYGQPGDYIRYYEINPEVIRLATDPHGYFDFIRNSHAKMEIIPGDARLSMERELQLGAPQRFDILTVDAFSGDAIPIHLLTEEAFETYLAELRSDGVIALHISNSYLDLRPVAIRLAQQFGLHYAWIHTKSDGRMYLESDWMLLARDDGFLRETAIKDSVTPLPKLKSVRLWTDDYSNLFVTLK